MLGGGVHVVRAPLYERRFVCTGNAARRKALTA
jgi:hypothetical protein